MRFISPLSLNANNLHLSSSTILDSKFLNRKGNHMTKVFLGLILLGAFGASYASVTCQTAKDSAINAVVNVDGDGFVTVRASSGEKSLDIAYTRVNEEGTSYTRLEDEGLLCTNTAKSCAVDVTRPFGPFAAKLFIQVRGTNNASVCKYVCHTGPNLSVDDEAFAGYVCHTTQ